MKHVTYRVEGAVAVIALDRPPMNALSMALTDDLEIAIGMAEDAAVRAVVITGEPHFAAGADITEFRAAHDSDDSGTLAGRLSRVVRHLELLSRPVIAAVHGYALGGGLELAMGADFIYMAEDAKVGQPEIKLGIIPGAGGTQRLYRLVGFGLAKELIYSGRFMGAPEALQAGLARKVVPSGDLLATALAGAAELAGGPTVALGAAKRAINDGWGRPMDDALQVEAEAFAACFGSDDAREGVAAFLEKRDPQFRGT